METRKLQKVGGSTYTVSVPKRWATEHRLEAGETVHLYTHADGSLGVRSAERDGSALDAVELTVAGESPARVERSLRAAYATGYRRVALRHETMFTAAQRRAVRDLARDLVGVEVVEESAECVELRSLLDPADVSVRQLVEQLGFVALAMHGDATEALVDERAGTDGIARRADEAARLSRTVARHFERSLESFEEVDRLGVSRRRLSELRDVAGQLRNVADHAVTLAASVDRLEKPRTEAVELGDVADEARSVVAAATDAVFARAAPATAHDVLDDCDEVRRSVDALERSLCERAPPEGPALARMLPAVAGTADAGGRIATVALRHAVGP